MRKVFTAAFATLALALSVAPVAADDSASLLAESDLFAKAPAEFRAELEIGRVGSDAIRRLEIYRKGSELELIRFLEPKDRGKFLLLRGDDLWFLAPGSRRPVALAPSYRVQGAAVHELLGLDLARDYRIEGSSEKAGIVTFDLAAVSKQAAAPRLTWVVSRESRRPLRADFRATSGKVLRVLEFRTWRDAARGVPERLVVKDVVAGGAPLEVRFTAFEARPVDERLFDLEDGSARATLLAATP